MGSGYLCKWISSNSLKLNTQEYRYNKVQNNRGYAPGLAWVKDNQKLVFHLRDLFAMVPSLIKHQVIWLIHRPINHHHRSYYEMQKCNACLSGTSIASTGINFSIINHRKNIVQYFSTKTCNIIYLMHRDKHKGSKTSWFSILRIFYDLLWISKSSIHLRKDKKLMT
jgi:hypothetical protein